MSPTRASATEGRRFAGRALWVSQVLEQVPAGLAWGTIVEEWRRSVTKEAIADAVRLANEGVFVHSRLTPDEILGLAAQVYADLSTAVFLPRGNPSNGDVPDGRALGDC